MQKIILGLVIILGLLYYFNNVKEGFSAQQLADLRRRRAEKEKEGTLNKITPLSQRQSTPFVRRSWRNRYKPCEPYTVVSYGGSRFQKCPRGWRHRGCNQAQRDTCEKLERTSKPVIAKSPPNRVRPRLPGQIAPNHFRVYDAITVTGRPGNYRYRYTRPFGGSSYKRKRRFSSRRSRARSYRKR